MKKRTIYIIVTSLLTGGAEKQAIWLANKFFDNNYEVRFVVLKKGDELSFLLNNEIPIRQFKLFSKKDSRFLARIRLAYWFLIAIRKLRRDIRREETSNITVISFLIHSNILAFFSTLFNRNVKHIMSVRSDRFTVRTSKISFIRHLIFYFISMQSSSIVFNSKNAMQKFKKLSIRKNNHCVIPNGITTDYPEINTAIESEIKKTVDSFKYKLFAAGRLDELNNYGELIKAIKILKDKGLNIGLVLFGDGWHRNTLEKQVINLQLENKISFFGKVKNIPNYFQLFDLAIHTATHGGLSNLIIESIYNKVPIAVTPIGDSQELIKEGRGIEIKGFDSKAIATAIEEFTQLDKDSVDSASERAYRYLSNKFDNNSIYEAWVDLVK